MAEGDIAPDQKFEQPASIAEDAHTHHAADNEVEGMTVSSASSGAAAVREDLAEGGLALSKRPSFLGLLPAPRLVLEGVLLIAFVALGLSVWSVSKDRDTLQSQLSSINANPQKAVDRQTTALINTVGSLIQLPSNETPTVAEVSNAAQAKTQSNFFASAENGDRALLYVNAKQAILYRPSTNKVILQAPLTFSSQTATGSPAIPGATTTKR
jgi:hypothetical protein